MKSNVSPYLQEKPNMKRPPWHHIKLTKTADKNTVPEHPVFEGYTVLGYCEKLPTVNDRLIIFRYNRNGVEKPGIMSTTPVTSIMETHNGPMVLEAPYYITFETENSSYRLDFLPNE